jgi:hypothetical protein
MATARTILVSDFLADIEFELKNTESIVPKTTELLEYLNKAYSMQYQLLVADKSDLIRSADTTFSTADGTEVYALSATTAVSTDLWVMHKIYLTTGAGANLTPLELVEEDERFSHILGTVVQRAALEATPTKYYLSNSNIGLLPVPDAIYTVHFNYYPNWVPLAISDNMPLKNLYNDALRESTLFTAKNRDMMPSEVNAQLWQILRKNALNVESLRRPNTVMIKPRFK